MPASTRLSAELPITRTDTPFRYTDPVMAVLKLILTG